MTITRRSIIAGAATMAALSRRPVRAQGGGKTPTIRIGVLTDLSGSYRDVVGPTAVTCVRQAVQEFTSGKDMNV
jgi:branched-chain amino acid transport system substrate-binding protein